MSVEENTVGSSDATYAGARLGHYQMMERIGAGATSSVYRACDLYDGTEVAIKVLELTATTAQTHIQRLQREAFVSTRIDHPNVVKVYELGRAPAKCVYLVMELVRGRTLLDILSAGPVEPQRAIRITREIARGLSSAHRNGFVHRDLKPANLMISEDAGGERVKILDFGIVGAIASAPFLTQLTNESSILGTPMYMAPEQVDAASVGPAADLYALGAVIYHMIAGRPPFVGSFREIIAQHMVAAPEVAPFAEGLGPLALALLAKEPENRPQSAESVIATLDELLLRSRPEKSADPVDCTPVQPVRSWSKSTPIVAMIAIFCGAMATRAVVMLSDDASAPFGTSGNEVEVREEPEPRSAPELREPEPARPSTVDTAPLAREKSSRSSRRPLLIRGADLWDDRAATYAGRLSRGEVRALEARLRNAREMLEGAKHVLPRKELDTLRKQYRVLAEMVRPELGRLGREGWLIHLESLDEEIANARARASNSAGDEQET